MKYTDTSKTLCLVFHTLLFLAFGALGIYFGVFVAPGFFNTNSTYLSFSDELHLISMSYIFYLELAVIGLSIATISVFGLLSAIKSINGGGDKEVVDSFAAFIAEGWLGAIFFVLNAGLFFGLIAGDSNIAFIIIVCLLFAIALLIAVNIPTVKLFDGKDSKPLLSKLTLAGAVTGGILFVIPTLSALTLQNMNAYKTRVYLQLFGIAIIGLLFCVSCAVAGLNIKKGGLSTKGGVALDSAMICGSTVISGAIMIALGICNLVWKSDTYPQFIWTEPSTQGVCGAWNEKWGLAYCIMLIIFGVLLVCGGVILVAQANKEKTKALAK